MAYYLYKLIPPRPTFADDMDEDEQMVMGQHVGYWSELAETGTALVFGPVADPAGAYGLAIVDADSEADVRGIGDADPAVTSRVCTYDVYAMPQTIVGQPRATPSS